MTPDTKQADQSHADDPENPEWTTEDFAQAVPFKVAHPELYTAWKRGGVEATPVERKVELALQLSPDIVLAIKTSGGDYNDRIEAVLRDALARGAL